MMDIGIYYCPWCDHNPSVERTNDGLFGIKCTAPDCPVNPKLKKYYPSIIEAANAWNHYVDLLEEKFKFFKSLNDTQSNNDEEPRDIINLAKDLLEARAEYGEEEYGQRLHPFVKGRFSLQDAIEEAADLFVYLLQFKEEMKSVSKIIYEMVKQACWDDKTGLFKSMGIEEYADALSFLDAVGKVKIIKKYTSRHVIAKPVEVK